MSWGRQPFGLASPAQTPKNLVSFDGTNGANPNHSALVQATDGNLYGTMEYGGTDNDGTVFEITPAGKLTSLVSFNGTNGANPFGPLVQATNGNFYGTTYYGGAHGYGTVYEITSAGKLTTLHSFCSLANCTDGAYPSGILVQATNGNFYGTTYEGGTKDYGTVYEITAGGKLTTLYSFCSQADCADGANPDGGVIQATNGNFYGTTEYGGADDDGTVFTMTPVGKLTSLGTVIRSEG